MGGLVVANSISRDLRSDEALQLIPDHTIGSLFLGTPFQGSSLASWGNLAVNLLTYLTRTQRDSLETLQKKSTKLADINIKFAKFLKERDRMHDMPCLQIACFIESIPILGNTLVVSKESATLLGVDPLYIDANHKKMCRFDYPEREGFQKVSGKLVQWIEEYEANKTAGGVGGLNAGVSAMSRFTFFLSSQTCVLTGCLHRRSTSPATSTTQTPTLSGRSPPAMSSGRPRTLTDLAL